MYFFIKLQNYQLVNYQNYQLTFYQQLQIITTQITPNRGGILIFHQNTSKLPENFPGRQRRPGNITIYRGAILISWTILRIALLDQIRRREDQGCEKRLAQRVSDCSKLLRPEALLPQSQIVAP